MSVNRDLILDWVEHGKLAPQHLEPALRVTEVYPTHSQWRVFFDRLLLWSGIALLGAAVVFFFAYNWAALGRYARFGLVEAPLAVAVWAAWHWGPERPAGKAALFLASLLVGALLALVGQTYQTGADTFELFAVWALAIAPWVILGRMPALGLLWLALANMAVLLYWSTFQFFLWLPFSPEAACWSAFVLNTLVLVAWEWGATRYAWLNERWAIRIVATASGVLVTTIALFSMLDFRDNGPWGLLAWAGWIAAAAFVYRARIYDLYVLAGGVLSTVVVVTTFLTMGMLKHSNAGGLLIIGLAVIGLSAAGAWWLRNVAREHAATGGAA